MYYLHLINQKKPNISRRKLLQQSSLLASAALLPGLAGKVARAQTTVADYPFKLGVASGDPLSDG